MKTSFVALAGLGLAAAVLAPCTARAGLFSNNVDMIAIAERGPGAAPSSGSPVSYVAFDGGYIEAGDPVGGETPPSADVVRASLHAALGLAHFTAATASPDVVLTYHWGVIRNDRIQNRVPYAIKPNLIARIELVGTHKLSAEVENHLLGMKRGSGMNEDAAAPRFLVGEQETVFQYARQARYFIIVSAYDYRSLAAGKVQLLWRVKASARDISGPMDTVIPAMIARSTTFFGQDLPGLQDVEAQPYTPNSDGTAAAAFSAAQNAAHLAPQTVKQLLEKEHRMFSGEMPEPSA